VIVCDSVKFGVALCVPGISEEIHKEGRKAGKDR